jgi:hypothetical protein
MHAPDKLGPAGNAVKRLEEQLSEALMDLVETSGAEAVQPGGAEAPMTQVTPEDDHPAPLPQLAQPIISQSLSGVLRAGQLGVSLSWG